MKIKKGNEMKTYGNFKDAGREETGGMVEASKKTKRTKTFGRITIDRDNFPFLKKKEIGNVCDLLIRVKKVEESVAEEWGTDKADKIRIEILKIAEPKAAKDEYKELIKDEEYKNKMKG